jgi:LuxR family maltose regulon positive regulatory protein
MFPAQPMLHTYYNQLLLAKHQWTEVIARHEECKEIYGVYNNVMCQIWLHIQQSAALEKLNRHEDAVVELSNALNMAVPDGIIMPFVESQVYIESILKELREKDMYIETIDHILSLAEEFRRGKQKILWAHWSEHEDYGLSQRELEIAKLAAMRKTNLEIADELHLAEGTVRNQLSRIFDKLDIGGSGKNKRTRLENLLKIKK